MKLVIVFIGCDRVYSIYMVATSDCGRRTKQGHLHDGLDAAHSSGNVLSRLAALLYVGFTQDR